MTTRRPEEILIEYGFFPETGDAQVEPFARACTQGLDEVVSAWLDLGMSPNAGDDARHEAPALHAAAEGGHVSTVKILVERGANIEARDSSDDTALRTALNWGHLEVARFLASRGADVEAVNKSGESALDHAIDGDKDADRELLLALGASPNFCRDGRSPMRTAIGKDAAVVAALLDAGGCASLVLDESGETALHYAVRTQAEEIVDLLLARGASCAASDAYGLTPLDYALLVDNDDLVEKLASAGQGPSPQQRARAQMWSLIKSGALAEALVFLEERDVSVEARSETNETPLMAFAGGGYVAGVRRLLARGALADARSKTDNAVTRAVSAGHDEVLGVLLAAGAPPVDANGDPAGIDDAIRGGHLDVVGRLLDACSLDQRARADKHVRGAVMGHNAGMIALLAEKQVPLEHRDECGDTPLIVAVADEHDLDVVRALLDGGADVDGATPRGETPLYKLLGAHQWDEGHEPTVRLLLERGARLDAVRRDGSTPFCSARDEAKEFLARELVTGPLEQRVPVAELARRHSWATLAAVVLADRNDLVLALIDAGVAVNPPRGTQVETVLHAAIEAQDVELVRGLIARGVDVNHAAQHESPVMVAAREASAEILTMLLDAGADPTWTTRNGRHALHWAVDQPHHIPLLIARGARVDDRVQTPLVTAVSEGSVEATRHLLEHGARVDVRDERGRTPLTLAITRGAGEVARLLIAAGASPTFMNRASGETPLTAAAQRGDVALVKLLLEKGGSLDDKNQEGDDVRSLLLRRKEA